MAEEEQSRSSTENPSGSAPAGLGERNERAGRPHTPLDQGPCRPPSLPSNTAYNPFSNIPISHTPRRAYTRRLVSDPIPQLFTQDPRSLSTPPTPLPPSPGLFYSPYPGFVTYVGLGYMSFEAGDGTESFI